MVANGHPRRSSVGTPSDSTASSSPHSCAGDNYEAKFLGMETFCIDKSQPCESQPCESQPCESHTGMYVCVWICMCILINSVHNYVHVCVHVCTCMCVHFYVYEIWLHLFNK